jgi:hypothetical protein
MNMSFEDEFQKTWWGLIEKLPTAVQHGIFDPKTSATNRLKYVEMAIRLFYGPIGRPETESDSKNARDAATMLRKVVPELEKIRREHRSERLRWKADQYLSFIATRVGVD